jgi:MoaA/NifB/PqqE/SkfB family radical SAM enzyme
VRYLEIDGGDPAGERVADVEYQGNVHLTQFWQGYSLGNVGDRPFGAICDDESNPLLGALRTREERLGPDTGGSAADRYCWPYRRGDGQHPEVSKSLTCR